MRHRAAVIAAAVLVGAVAGMIALGTLRVSGTVGPGEIEFRAAVGSDGTTRVGLPPLGRISADTHDAPVHFRARVDRLHIEQLQQLFLVDKPDDAAMAEVRRDLGPLLRRYVVRAALVGLVAGALGGALFPRRRVSTVVAGAIGGVVAVSALLGAAWAQYEPAAFEQPEFEGPIERAPGVIEAARRHVESFAGLRDRLEALSVQVADLYAASTAEVAPEDGQVKILHVSDIHSNPLGLELARQLATSFGVDAVVDTGDLTSFGLPVEARIGDLLAGFEVPYYFVPGNHDSTANREALGAIANVHLLDGEVVEIAGVRVLGVADPTFTASNELEFEETVEIKEQEARVVARQVRRLRPEVLAVHDARLAERVIGRVPVVLAGHVHKRQERLEEGTLTLVVGTTGALGLESFTVEEDIPYEAQILRFAGDRLVAVDYVSVAGVDGNFQVERKVYDHLLALEPRFIPGRPH